jgi:hypothetical protein
MPLENVSWMLLLKVFEDARVLTSGENRATTGISCKPEEGALISGSQLQAF